MKEVKQITFEKRAKDDFETFCKALNKQDETKKFSGLIWKNYKDGVIFGDNTHLTFLKDSFMVSARPDCYALGQIFDNAYRSLDEYEEATFTRGTTPYHKKTLKVSGRKKTAYLNEALVGDIPKGAKFYVYNHKTPVLVVYNGEIIKFICPFLMAGNESKFTEAI